MGQYTHVSLRTYLFKFPIFYNCFIIFELKDIYGNPNICY